MLELNSRSKFNFVNTFEPDDDFSKIERKAWVQAATVGATQHTQNPL